AGTSGGARGPGGPGGEAPAGGSGAPAGGRSSPATTVGIATAEKSSIPVTLEALGTVTPQATVRVRPQVSGVLQKVLFTEGQTIKAGTLMATIDPRPFELALMQAVGQRQQGEAQLGGAQVQLERFKTLLAQDSIARQEVDTQAALVRQLEGTMNVNKAAEGTARLNLAYTRIVAPVSGRVGLRTVDVGNVVASSDANGIALITQIAPIDVVFSVPQDRAGELQQALASGGGAMKATAFDRTRSTALEVGQFASLDNQVDIATGTVRAKARFANAALALFPNQFVNVQLVVRNLVDVVTVPLNAVRYGTSGDYVYVLDAVERTVALRPVKRGLATAEKVVITSGLKAGEQVITEGADRLKDGARVALPGDAPRAPRDAASGPRGKRGQADPAQAAGDAASRPRRPASAAEAP
ncbi:MAG: efflux RND transporter periplasmic adaptor subunit, partial [Polaromonas sp.]|nr:efflux RND transporter periplasmic adaptor subunit [Polaromonas sp.]